MIATINPTTEEIIQTFTPLTTAEIETKLQLADSTFENYRKSSFESRADKLLKAATILEDDASEWAKLMTLEMGKPFQKCDRRGEQVCAGMPILCRAWSRFFTK